MVTDRELVLTVLVAVVGLALLARVGLRGGVLLVAETLLVLLLVAALASADVLPPTAR